jgi:hypothetical protein
MLTSRYQSHREIETSPDAGTGWRANGDERLGPHTTIG